MHKTDFYGGLAAKTGSQAGFQKDEDIYQHSLNKWMMTVTLVKTKGYDKFIPKKNNIES